MRIGEIFFLCQKTVEPNLHVNGKVLIQRERLSFKERECISDKNAVPKTSGGRIQSTGTGISFRQEERSSPTLTGGTKSRVCAGPGDGVSLVG